MKYGDNRDMPVKDLSKKEKYHKHIASTVDAFMSITNPCSVLDIGSRDGYAVELLCNNKYNAIGIELIPEYVAYARDRGRNVVCDNILYLSTTIEVDAIFSRHCIEHVNDPLRFLRVCEVLLRPQGTLFLTFPLETKKQFKARKGGEHLCHFPDKDSFRALIDETSIIEKEFCKSKREGIIPDGKEVMFIGQVP